MRVALFVTCLVDLFRPTAAYAAVKLLQQGGCVVEIPTSQTCCGQPAFNNGDKINAQILGRQVIDTFKDFDYVVVPSGSCTGMLRIHYPNLFKDDPEYRDKAIKLAMKCHELTGFLVDVLKISHIDTSMNATITYHDSCSCLREAGIKEQPRQLLNSLKNAVFKEIDDSETCCGFGGTFCVKYPELSERMVNDKINSIQRSEADMVVSADLGCLMNIAGKISRLGLPIKAYHIAEVLAGMTDGAGIGESRNK